MSNPLPLTSARLSSAVFLRAYTQTGDLGSALLQVPVTPGQVLSVIQEFEPSETRANFKRYSLGTYAFNPYDIIPQRLDEKLHVSRLMLYATDVLEEFGLVMSSSFIDQIYPLLIQEVQVVPDFGKSWANNPPGVRIINYQNCWFESRRRKYSIKDADQLILEDVDFTVGSIDSDTKSNLNTLDVIDSSIKLVSQISNSQKNLISNAIKFFPGTSTPPISTTP